MKVSHVSAFGRAARILALAAVTLGVGAAPLLAQGTGKIEGRVRDQAGAPIVNAQVIIVGTAFNAETNPQGYYFINNVPGGHHLGSRRLHRVQVDPGRRRQGARRSDRHGGHPAGADAGRDPGDHGRHPDPAAGAARRGDLEAAHRRRVHRQPAGGPAERRARASAGRRWPARPATPSRSVAAAPTRRSPTWTGCRCHRASGASASPPPPAPRSRVGTNALEEASVTTGLVLGGVRQRAVRHHRGSDPSRRRRVHRQPRLRNRRAVRRHRRLRVQPVPGQRRRPALAEPVVLRLRRAGRPEVGRDRVRRGAGRRCSSRPAWTPWSRCRRRSATPPPTPRWSRSSTTPRTGVTAMTSPAAPTRTSRTTTAWTARASGRPYSARTTYNLQGKLELHLRHRLPDLADRPRQPVPGPHLRAEPCPRSGRIVTYGNLYNPDGLLAFRNWSRNLTLNWTQNLSKSAERALALETYLSYQQDDTLSGPDDPGERARAPAIRSAGS